MDLLREADGPEGRLGLVALPAFEGPGGLVAAAVALPVHHEERERLCPAGGHSPLVVRAVDVQVVIDGHLDGVVVPQEPARQGGGAGEWAPGVRERRPPPRAVPLGPTPRPGRAGGQAFVETATGHPASPNKQASAPISCSPMELNGLSGCSWGARAGPQEPGHAGRGQGPGHKAPRPRQQPHGPQR